ncbi:hypothetical protein HRI_003027600 [Hibiscus trionum]|uniref:Uncharacterized protein n=1 Tax=Hibiscus trionum TaxID=183268 RepID=A0A9W7IDT5_HIBTR|nr:hypothetical protein HRI_003027600 [Hibiscus trionum]
MADIFSIATLQQTLCTTPMAADTPIVTPPPLAPFSAVVPVRFVAVSRLNIHITLETIHEEDSEEEIYMEKELSQNSSPADIFSINSFLRSEERSLAVM